MTFLLRSSASHGPLFSPVAVSGFFLPLPVQLAARVVAARRERRAKEIIRLAAKARLVVF